LKDELSGVVIAFGKGCQEMMDVHSQLLILGVLPKHSFGIMVAERKRVDRLNLRISTPEGVPLPSYRNKRGTNESTLKKQVFSMYLGSGLSKPAGNVASTQRII